MNFATLKIYWESFSAREQSLLKVLFTVFCVVILLQGMIIPAHNYMNLAKERLATAQNDIKKIDQAISSLPHSPIENTKMGGLDYAAVLESTAQELAIYEFNIERSQSFLHTKFAGITSAQLFQWLHKINSIPEIAIESIEIEADELKSGINATVVIEESGR